MCRHPTQLRLALTPHESEPILEFERQSMLRLGQQPRSGDVISDWTAITGRDEKARKLAAS